MRTVWNVEGAEGAEASVEKAGLRENTRHRYVDETDNFVRLHYA